MSFGLVSYGVIVNIFFTTLYIHTFQSFEKFTEANILSRDILFIMLYMVLSGFILGKLHLLLQGVLILVLIFDFILIKKDDFFINNATIYIAALIAFVSVLYFIVGTLDRLVKRLADSNALANALRKQEQDKNEKLIQYQDVLLSINKDQKLLNAGLEELFGKICLAAARTMGTS
jgi:uncharacterized membrane protein